MGNKQEESNNPDVKIKLMDGQYIVDPPMIEVERGDKVKFITEGFNAKIGFPDSGIVENGSWFFIEKGPGIELTIDANAPKGDHYYAVMCKYGEEYWYAEGNSCPGMKVG